ncbi:MAG TPA: MoaF N-terminal domain-containing protein [Thermoanaerobaculia bacterium]|nr:MoaF N-terminal domain-containing protein [Thermoanaerobaculia bacterium]
MSDKHLADEVRGKTMRWTWTEGPTQGSTHEHVFHEDGTVEWRGVDASQEGAASGEGGEKKAAPAAKYAAIRITDEVCVVSYLAPESGYTLTVVLNFRDHSIVGFASGAKEWFPIEGAFEVVS